jgi:transposase
LAKQRVALKEIVRRTGKSRGLVRQVVHGGRKDIFRSRLSSLDPFPKQLDEDWTTGCRNGAALWRRAKLAGFAGGLRVIAEWASRRRNDERTATGTVRPARCRPRAIARMMTTERGLLPKAVARTMAIIESAIPALVTARDLMDRFHSMIKRRAGADLEPWITDAAPGLLGSFVKGIVQDRATVHAALTPSWSNGRTEGQNTKLKMVKRQMYGRANLDLLRARLLGAA